MTTFPTLLRKTYADCIRVRKPIGIAILITGGITVLLSVFVWQIAVGAGVRELGKILGPEKAAEIEQHAWAAGTSSGMQQVIMEVGQAMEVKLASMSEEEKDVAIETVMTGFFTDVFPVMAGFALLAIILTLWNRSFFLVLGVRGKGKFGEVAADAFAWMLPLLGVGILTSLLVIAWVIVSMLVAAIVGAVLSPIVGFVVAVPLMIGGALYLGPRLALAPVILFQDRAGVIGSLKRSFRMTEGKWWKVFSNLLGAGAMVWIVLFAIQIIVNILARVAMPFPPAPFIIGQMMVFASLAGAAYSTVFVVRLKEAVAGGKR